ncbi:hypothetical protein JW948_04365 [bacterium]|nr:hypothetical protein [bacterium]
MLTRILESSQFNGSELYQNLLTYLFEAYQSGYAPKEISIAHDVFKKGSDFNSAENPSVRVHMHNLRNKLNLYYQSEGREDEFQLTIPKGHYRITINKRKSVNKESVLNSPRLVLPLIVLLAVSTLYLAIDKYRYQKSHYNVDSLPTKSCIWDHFFNNEMQNSIIIGDFLIFHEMDEELGRVRRIQDYQINTEDELENFIRTHPRRNIAEFPLGEIPHNSLFNIIDLDKVFQAYQHKFRISFSSEIDIDYIKGHNVIYIGEFKNLRVLSDLIATLPFHYQTLPDWMGTISFTQNDSLITLKADHNWEVSRYVEDLGVIAKLPGQNHEHYLMVMGFGYNSQMKMIDILSNKTALRQFETQIIEANDGKMPEYFFSLFKVVGFDRASTTATMELFQEIKPDIYQHYTAPTK